MEEFKNRSSILISIFNRKGGEGVMTKIVRDSNKPDFQNQISLLDKEEQPLLCFKKDELNWLLITSSRIIGDEEGVKFIIPYSQLIEVKLAMEQEFKNRTMNKGNFTRLALKDNSDRTYLIKLEKGPPYQGIYQILHYIVSNNNNKSL